MITPFVTYYVIIPIAIVGGWWVLIGFSRFAFSRKRAAKHWEKGNVDGFDIWFPRIMAVPLLVSGIYGTACGVDAILAFHPPFTVNVDVKPRANIEVRAESGGKVRHGVVEKDGEGRAVIRWSD